MKIVFSFAARDDLVRLRKFIHIHDPGAATRAAQRILEAVNMLENFPQLGKPVRFSEEYRDLTFTFCHNGYVLRYRLTEDIIRVLRIWHVREDKE